MLNITVLQIMLLHAYTNITLFFSFSIVFKILFCENTQYLLESTLHKKNPEVLSDLRLYAMII